MERSSQPPTYETGLYDSYPYDHDAYFPGTYYERDQYDPYERDPYDLEEYDPDDYEFSAIDLKEIPCAMDQESLYQHLVNIMDRGFKTRKEIRSEIILEIEDKASAKVRAKHIKENRTKDIDPDEFEAKFKDEVKRQTIFRILCERVRLSIVEDKRNEKEEEKFANNLTDSERRDGVKLIEEDIERKSVHQYVLVFTLILACGFPLDTTEEMHNLIIRMVRNKGVLGSKCRHVKCRNYIRHIREFIFFHVRALIKERIIEEWETDGKVRPKSELKYCRRDSFTNKSSGYHPSRNLYYLYKKWTQLD